MVLRERIASVVFWWLVPLGLVLWLVGGREVAARPFCWLWGHAWDDDRAFGSRPVCLCCGRTRSQES